MKKDEEMRGEYDFSRAERGKFYGKVTGARVVKSRPRACEGDVEELAALFRKLWNKAEGQEGYVKSEWKKLERLLNKHDIPV